jgi:hypothetical protein
MLAVGLLGLTTALALADGKANSYETIFSQNPFRLKAPAPPPDPAASQPPAPPTPQPTVKLTGITTILSGKPKAILEITEPGGKGPAKQRILEEGIRLDTIEILAINVASNLVTVRIGDAETNLTFASAETTKTPGPPGAPGVVPGAPFVRPPGFPAIPGAVMSPTPFVPGGAAAPSASPSSVFVAGGGGAASATGGGSAVTTFGATSPTAAAGAGIPRVPGVGAYGTPTPNPSILGAMDTGLRTIPTRPIRTDGTAPQTPAGGASGRPMTREEVDMLIELNRVRKPANAPPLPPTSLSSMIDHPDTKYFPPSMQSPPAPPVVPNQ